MTHLNCTKRIPAVIFSLLFLLAPLFTELLYAGYNVRAAEYLTTAWEYRMIVFLPPVLYGILYALAVAFIQPLPKKERRIFLAVLLLVSALMLIPGIAFRGVWFGAGSVPGFMAGEAGAQSYQQYVFPLQVMSVGGTAVFLGKAFLGKETD